MSNEVQQGSKSIRGNRSEWAWTAFAVIVVAALGIAAWHFIVKLFDLPKLLLPTPWQVAEAGWQHRDVLLKSGWITLWTATVSLFVAVIIGGAVSILFSQSRLLRRALFPYVVFLQTVPIVAIAPLLVIWSGYEFRTAVIATVIICLFPIVNNVTTGLTSVRPEHNDLLRMYGATRWQRLCRAQIPTAIPFLVLGARISSGLAVIGAIVAEFFVSNGADYEGLGAVMTGWQARTMTDALMAALAVSTLLGLILFGGVNLLSRLFLKRYLLVN
ncbi:ABC transporter, permease protein putative membrane protein [Rhodopirellula baltica SH28]|uniref:ABC transporter, permease protein putative membrane protein n=1 Tax=Rhodopirellula baltica SH28 TaxID=993517 RepID=K5C919_RHOBT|nr:ABC transporter permease [Rhodopirellula baltica]EKJ99574.1 ABC transporter, permease protein putative membrane protein [Rhodopirellula baltica SH28]